MSEERFVWRRFPLDLWPVATAVIVSVAMQKVFFEARFEVGGHAAEHLASATAPFLAVAVVFALLWATPSARRQFAVLASCAGWLATTVLVLVGNVRVIDGLEDAGLSTAPTNGLPDVADHGLANLAPWLGVVAAVMVILVLWGLGHISPRAALGSIATTIVFPPWIIPGAGVPALAIWRCILRERTSLAGSDDPLSRRVHG